MASDNNVEEKFDDFDEARLKIEPENNDGEPDNEDMSEESTPPLDDVVLENQDNDNAAPQETSFNDGSEDPEDLAPNKVEPANPNQWTLPADKDICTLEEIRRGQVINRVAPNECPVPGCGKKINESSLEPSPGTIASGLRTHVLFVHYANRKGVKKRKLGWSTKRRSSASPRKLFAMSQSHDRSSPMSNTDPDFDTEPENFAFPSNGMDPPLSSGTSLIQRSFNAHNRSSPPGSLLNKKIRQLSASQGPQQSSLQSLMQATGMGLSQNNGTRFSPQNKQKGQDLSASQKNFNQTTSSLFSILAGLTQQPQQQSQQRSQLGGQSQQQSLPRNVKAAHSANTMNVSQCSKNSNFTHNNNNNNNNSSNNNNNNFISNPPMNSSLLSLLNEKISGNVASSLQTQLKKSFDSSQNNKIQKALTPGSRTNNSTTNNPYYQANLNNNETNSYNGGTSILNNLCSNNGDLRNANNESSSLCPFIESIAKKTGSNIGPAGVSEAKKIIEKFTTWLICSSQTIADHYIAPFANEAPQQKPEISASDVILAYKMMQKSHPQ